MRCKACDIILEEYELNRKCSVTNSFLDLCSQCANISDQVLEDTYNEDE
jgi:hypothetical protein